MRANQEKIFKLVGVAEGGYCNDFGDPGGPTKFGITIHDLIAWRKGGQLTSSNFGKWTEEVKKLELHEALDIYSKKYWDPVRADELPSGIDLLIFDLGINAGPSVGIKKMQKCLGVTQDGVFGTATLKAIWALKGFAAFNDGYYDAKMAFYRSLHNWPQFGNGWTNRANKMKREALSMFKDPAIEMVSLPDATKVLLGLSSAPPADQVEQPEATKVWS